MHICIAVAYYSSHAALPISQEAEFHHYCRPWLNPVLTDFCKKLTGIRQVSGALLSYVAHAICCTEFVTVWSIIYCT